MRTKLLQPTEPYLQAPTLQQGQVVLPGQARLREELAGLEVALHS
jgi:hypothetical protein